jgi:hypothetical protein
VPEATPGLWTQADGRITFATARISVPLSAGAVRFQRTAEFSHPGEGLDSALQYRSPDGQVFATIYVYYPGLPHAGLTAFATDEAIHTQSPQVRVLGSRVAGAAGRDGIAIRTDYGAFRDGLASSAAFIKAGRWIVKLRVSGPEARRREVEAAMAALLDGLRFEGEVQPRAAAPLEIGECANRPTAPASLLPGGIGDVGAAAVIGTFDGAGEEARDATHGGTTVLPARFQTHWCLSTRARIGESVYPILRIESDAGAGGLGGRSVLAVTMNDAGTLLELVETGDRRRFVLLYHEIGRTAVLGSYDRPLTDEQVANILSGADQEGQRFRASVRLRPGRGADIDVEAPANPATSPTT